MHDAISWVNRTWQDWENRTTKSESFLLNVIFLKFFFFCLSLFFISLYVIIAVCPTTVHVTPVFYHLLLQSFGIWSWTRLQAGQSLFHCFFRACTCFWLVLSVWREEYGRVKLLWFGSKAPSVVLFFFLTLTICAHVQWQHEYSWTASN